MLFTGVGVAITAGADTMCSYTGAGTGISAGAGVEYPTNRAGAQYTASAVAFEEADPAHMMRHNQEGLVRQMCDAGAVGATFIVSPAFVPCRLERACKARLAWSVENPGSKANKRRTMCTTNSATTLRKLEVRLELQCTRILRYCRIARWRLYPKSHQRRPRSRA